MYSSGDSDIVYSISNNLNLKNKQEKFDENDKNTIVFIYEFVNVLNENIFSYPFLRLRKIIQIDGTSSNYYINPVFSLCLFFHINSKQGFSALTQGLPNFLVNKGVFIALENLLNLIFTGFIGYSKKNLIKDNLKSILSKSITFVIFTPFICTSTKDMVQSQIVYTPMTILEYLQDTISRAFQFEKSKFTPLIPIYLLIPPTVTFGILNHYLVLNAKFFINVIKNFSIREKFKDKQTKVYNKIIISITANLITGILLYKSEVILNRLYIQGTRTLIDNFNSGHKVKSIATCYLGFFDCQKSILQKEGECGFYRGIGCLILQYSFQYCIMNLTKYLVKKMFSA